MLVVEVPTVVDDKTELELYDNVGVEVTELL